MKQAGFAIDSCGIFGSKSNSAVLFYFSLVQSSEPWIFHAGDHAISQPHPRYCVSRAGTKIPSSRFKSLLHPRLSPLFFNIIIMKVLDDDAAMVTRSINAGKRPLLFFSTQLARVTHR